MKYRENGKFLLPRCSIRKLDTRVTLKRIVRRNWIKSCEQVSKHFSQHVTPTFRASNSSKHTSDGVYLFDFIELQTRPLKLTTDLVNLYRVTYFVLQMPFFLASFRDGQRLWEVGHIYENWKGKREILGCLYNLLIVLSSVYNIGT